MTTKIKQVFPRMLLAFGLAFTLSVSMPSVVASVDDLNIKLPGFGQPLSYYVREIDKIPGDREINWKNERVHVNTETGEVTIVRTSLPDSPAFSGKVTAPTEITEKISFNVNTGEYSISRSEKSANGWVDNELWKGNRYKNNSFYKAEETHIEADNRKRKITYNNDGTKASETKWDSKGRLISFEVYLNDVPGGRTITQKFDPETGEKTAVIVKNADGSSTTSIIGPDGKTAYVTNCDKDNNCKTEPGKSFAAGGMKQQQTIEDKLDLVGAKSVIQTIEKARERERLQADVLQQIEGKPRGDFLRAKEKSQTSVLEHLGGKPGEEVGLNPQPLPPRPQSSQDAKGNVLTDGATLGGLPAKEKPTTSLADKIQKRRGEAVGLNPQPLPPDPPPDKLSGKAPFDKKLRTEGVQPFRDKTKVQDVTGVQKEKLRLTPRSQSVGQVFQDSGAAKQNVQPQAVQPFKGKTKPQDFRLPAGSSAPVLR